MGKKYVEQGEESLENKRKPGNPLMKYSRRKELSDLEKLEYENMRLRIENERLKKGYMMKGDGSVVRDSKHGNNTLNHREALKDMLNTKIKREYKDLETIFHTDQGAVYSSLSFNATFENTSIIRSMSRAGTPTDNPVIESKNGWLKKEMYIDFDINNYNTVQDFIKDIVKDNNEYRPSYALNYKTPVEYRTQLGFP